MTHPILLAVTAALLAGALAPLVRRLGIATGAVDHPGGRKVHAAAVPRLGGLAICGAVLGGLGLWAAAGWTGPRAGAPDGVVWWLCGVGAVLMVGIGVVDDLWRVGAGPKLAVEGVAAALALAGGVGLDAVPHPFGGEPLALGWLAGPVTVLWIVGVTNALNLIDGLDGLAAGIGLIVTAALAGTALALGRTEVAVLAVALGGALAGFLCFNFNPASIFLGDSGSLLLGYALAILAIEGTSAAHAPALVLAPLLALALPITDTVLTVTRRFVGALRAETDGETLGRRLLAGAAAVLQADRDHVHHRLMSLGLSHRGAVLALYGACLALDAGAVLAVGARAADGALLVAAAVAGLWLGVRRLGYRLLAVSRTAAPAARAAAALGGVPAAPPPGRRAA